MARTLTSIIGGLLLVQGVLAQNIVGYEYWFDQNDNARIYVPVTPGTTVNLTNAQLNTGGLSLGQHQACLRWKDQPAAGQARWSSVVCRTLQVGQPGPWEIIAVRYWVGTPVNDSDPLIRYKFFDTPQDTITYIGLLDLCGFPTNPPQQTLKLQLLDNHDQWSSVVTRAVTINPAGNLGAPFITASATTFCPGDTVTFTATPGTGATPTGYNWLIPATPGWNEIPSTGSTIVVTIGEIGGTVQATATNFCGQGAPGSFTVNVQTFPDQPGFITGPLQACIGTTVTYSTPQVPGISYTWAISGGWWDNESPEAFIETVIGGANATISVIPTNSCGDSGPAREEQITVTAPPDAGVNGSLAICSNADSVSLFTYLQGTPSAGGVWRLNGVVVSGLYNPAVNNPGVYTYTVSGSGPCPDATASVTVTEPQAPNAGEDAAITLCSNAGTQVMVNNLGGTPDGGGTWSGPSTTGGNFNPATMLGGVYTYTVNGTAPCGNASATLTIVVQQAPNAGVGDTLELCEGSSPVALINSLTGSPALNGEWTGPDGLPFLGVFTPGQSTEGTYTYTVQGSGVCADASSTLMVNVMHLQITAINGPAWVPDPIQLIYNVQPIPNDADSILWTLPPGWTWDNDSDHYDDEAFVTPDSTTGDVQICAQAVGGGCDGNVFCFDVTVTVGVEEFSGGGAGQVIYPNPNDGRFTVQLEGLQPNTPTQVINVAGEIVSEFSISSAAQVVVLEGLPSGAYTLKWSNGNRNGMRRFVIAR